MATEGEHVDELRSQRVSIAVLVPKNAVEDRPLVKIKKSGIGRPLEEMACHFENVVLRAEEWRRKKKKKKAPCQKKVTFQDVAQQAITRLF